MKYCKICVYPDTKPELKFDEHGICSACNNNKLKSSINWEERKSQFSELLEKYRSKNDSTYDCIIPVSGGKDSTYQAYVMKEEFGMNPLLVNFLPRDLVPLGRKNIENLKNLGFDYIEFTANPIVYRKLAKIGLMELGDVTWPEHHGLFTVPTQIAVAYNIPLIVWGENPHFEYGGLGLGFNLDRKWLVNHGGYFLDKMPIEKVTSFGINMSDLKPYLYPKDEQINQVGVTGVFLGSYIKWDIFKQLEIVKKLGLSVSDKPKEGTYQNWENLDEKYTGMHDYFKWIKYGFGRATDHACIDISYKKINREQAIELVKNYEGKIPTWYFDEFLNDFELTKEEFFKIVDKFANHSLFKKNALGELWRDDEDNLELLESPY
jgi:N-acetyl sugar amidotransferase